MFPTTKFFKTENRVLILNGTEDTFLPWDEVKLTFEGKYEVGKDVILVEGAPHDVSKDVENEMVKFLKKNIDQ